MTVVDASVLLRRLRWRSAEASAVLRRGELAAPALIVAETANGLAGEVRFAGLDAGAAAALLREGLALPIELVPDRELAIEALAVATELDLSAYDASYIVLAERLRVPLVTADRRLAERYGRSELIP
jgi:predicted nucleic acid-binding protein